MNWSNEIKKKIVVRIAKIYSRAKFYIREKIGCKYQFQTLTSHCNLKLTDFLVKVDGIGTHVSSLIYFYQNGKGRQIADSLKQWSGLVIIATT